jgi:hypothetical protein
MPFLAIGAADLVAVVVAVMALMVLLGFWVFAKPISAVLHHVGLPQAVPLVGGANLGNVWDALVSVSVQGLVSVLDPLTVWAAHAIWAVAAGPWQWVFKVTDAIKGLFAQLAALAQTVARDAVNAYEWGLSVLAMAEAAAYGFALAAIEAAEQYALAAVQVAIHLAEYLYNQALAAVAATAATLVGYMDDLYNRAIAYAFSVLGLAEDFATRLADDVRSEAVTLFGYAEQAVSAVEAEVQAIEGDITGIQTELDPLVAALPLVASIPLLESLVQTITADVTECLDPLCNTVTPNANQLGDLGKLLKGLEGLAEAGALAALLTAAVADPKAAATGVVDVMGWVTPLGVTLADAAGLAL